MRKRLNLKQQDAVYVLSLLKERLAAVVMTVLTGLNDKNHHFQIIKKIPAHGGDFCFSDCSKFLAVRPGASVHIAETHDVVFAEIVAALDFNKDDRRHYKEIKEKKILQDFVKENKVYSLESVKKFQKLLASKGLALRPPRSRSNRV